MQACNDWLRLGPGRTVSALLDAYGKVRENAAPSQSRDTLETWSRKFDWAGRAAAFDAVTETEKNDRRAQVMESGLALDYERVEKLKALAAMLEGELYERNADGRLHNLWQPDVKQIGSGEFAERVDIERFNGALISEYRATLDDLAKETGGRKAKVEHSGSIGVTDERIDDTERSRRAAALLDSGRTRAAG